MRLAAMAAAAALSVATLPAHAATYFAVQTGMQGGQTGIDAVSTSSWVFTTGGTGWSFGGGYFEMKEGPSTIADITLSVYQGVDANGTPVVSKTLTNADFCAAGTVANCQSFDVIPFLFSPAAVAMAPNTTYFVALTSPAGTGGSEQYFIKGQTSTLTFRLDGPTGEDAPPDIVTSVSTTGDPSAIPEPLTLALFGTGLLGLTAARRVSRRERVSA